MTRTFKVRGQETFGVELSRDGARVTLRTHSAGWPFPQVVTYDRSELVWIAGDPEPAPEPEREEPPEAEAPEDTTGHLFDEEGGQ